MTLERLQHILHQSLRTYGKPTGVWTLALAADVCYEHGVTERLLSDETTRHALKRLETNWKWAEHWITSPDPQYARKKKWRDRLIALALEHPDWVLGCQDEVCGAV